MVNDSTAKVTKVLNILKNTPDTVSGERMAGAIGVSRVAVWKIISRLNEKGYRIESSKSGYRLVSSADIPLPWEMAGTGAEIEYFTELDSTMARAAVLIESGCADGTTVIAGTQTAGRASYDRGWSSPDGGLYFTRIRTIPFPAAFSGLYPLAVCCAVLDAIREQSGIETGIEWPAEICSNGKKVGGVLTEFRGKNGMTTSVAAGVGLNINTEKAFLPAGAAGICELAGCTLSVRKLTAGIIELIEQYDRLIPGQVDSLISKCGKNLTFMGKKIEVKFSDHSILNGTASGLNRDGSVRLDIRGQAAVSVYSGDIIKYE